MENKIEFEKSTGNVFADLELENPHELQARSMIGFHVIELLKDKNMKQREIGSLLGIKQAEVSHLLNGHYSRFSIEKLIDFLKPLNQKVTIKISPHREGEPYQNIVFGA